MSDSVSGPANERTVAALPEVTFADGSRAAVELVLSGTAVPDADVFAGLVFLQDRSGRFAVVYSPRRQEWASPGGGREEAESPPQIVVREVLEETGLELDAQELTPCGYERFRPLTPGRWPSRGGVLQVFRTRLDHEAPTLDGAADDVTDARWVTYEEFEALCGGAFWWPMAAALFSPRGGSARGQR